MKIKHHWTVIYSLMLNYLTISMDFLKEHENKVLSGKEVKEIMGKLSAYFIKFTNDTDKHYGMKYVTGLNVDIVPFNPRGSCSEGGIYFCHIYSCFDYIYAYGDFARQVILPDDAKIYVEKEKVKADKVILGEKFSKKNLVREMMRNASILDPNRTKKCLMEILKVSVINFKYVNELTGAHDIMIEIIKKNGHQIKDIDQEIRTHEMMVEAVKSAGYAIRHINQEYRTDEIMIESVKNNGDAIKYIKQEFRTKEMMIEAIKNKARAIRHIKQEFRTDEMMIEAVKKNGNVIQFIDQEFRTDEMMILAVKNRQDAVKHIPPEIAKRLNFD